MKLEILEHLTEMNSKAPPLLFIHGAFHGAWCWKENFLPYFSSKGFHSYALSLRGHGESEGREEIHSFSLSDYMDDVLEVMQFLKNKPVLVGHSMGGAIVQKILHLHQDRIKAVVLIASVPPNGMMKDELRLTFASFIQRIQLSLFGRSNYQNNMTKLFFSKELPVKKRNELIRFLQSESNKARKELIKQIVPKSIGTKVPMLILGSKKDYIFSEKTTIHIGENYKTKPVIFPNISHDMMLDPNWKTVAEEILSFLYETTSKKEEREKDESTRFLPNQHNC